MPFSAKGKNDFYKKNRDALGFINFITIFFFVYGGMHIYLLFKVEKAFPALRRRLFTIPLVAMFTASPVLVRMFEQAGWVKFVLPMTWFSNIWMGLLFLFVFVAIFSQFLWWIVTRVHLFSGLMIGAGQRARLLFVGPMLFALVLAAYGWQEANNIRLETIDLYSPKISGQLAELRVVQISDVHLGLMVGQSRLAKIIKLVEKARPDILVCTGDIIEGHGKNLGAEAAMLAAVQAPLGKYAVFGNHEFYGGSAHALDFFKAAGLTVLRGEARRIAGIITIAGVDDKRGHGGPGSDGGSEQDLLQQLPPDSYTIFLKHRPVPPAGSGSLVDLQLSGHGHKGQIFPFNFLVRLFLPYPSGLVEVEKDHYLYTSRGSGTWGPPMRVGASPEVTLFRIRPLPVAGEAEKIM